jgi:hypothetical protein
MTNSYSTSLLFWPEGHNRDPIRIFYFILAFFAWLFIIPATQLFVTARKQQGIYYGNR